VARALARSRSLDADRTVRNFDLVHAALGAAARAALEAEMKSNYEYRSEFAKRYFAEGKALGIAAGEADALLRILTARGLELDEAARRPIAACSDVELLRRWIERAATASSAGDVFDD
jgi:hypothetical protein